MTLRSRLAAAPPAALAVPVAKTFGSAVPAAMEAAEERARMTPASPFSPGPPIGPYEGYDRTPRATPFVTGYNISTRPRTHERVSFETIKGLVDAYDVSQIVINHRIDSLRSLDWKLIAMDGYSGDVAEYVPKGVKALDKPDRVHYFETWLGKWLWDELAYGCGPLYRLRNRAGRCIGLLPVDCVTIAPLLDYWGLPPGAMEQGTVPDSDLPPSHVQYVNGLPWNWLTRADLIYEPYRLHNDSPYGRAPIESIILNANTDIRFQLFFLQTFTEGNLPAAFASSPETWTPEQIETFQEYWDGFMYGDQSRKHQIRWLPPGSKFEWSNEKQFTDTFSLFLMRKTCAAYHVVPADLGFTENVNRSSGESQADVQHRVGDLPFIRYVQRILTSFLQDDLKLPLKFAFDLGEEQDDRAEQANADKIYVDMGAVGVSELREMRYGLTDPQPIPRYIFTERAGPIPIASLLAVAGQIDPETGLPAAGAPLPEEVFGGTEGVLPNPPIKVMSLAEREFGPKAMPPAPPAQPVLQPGQVGQSEAAQVTKEGEAAGGNVTAGITAATGLYSYDLDDGQYGSADEEERELAAERARGQQVAKEMAAFRRFAKARRREGEWRDFRFRAVPPVRGHNLNDDGRLSVRKAAGEVAVAGLAVLAADTGRVLMLQRALDDSDPAAGTWEFPGGHLEGDESPLAAAWREWQEETGVACAPGVQSGTWASGIYQGIVWTIESESMIPVRGEAVIGNPDDPDGDQCESIAWWDPATLSGNPAVRPELADSLGDVLPLLGCGTDGPAQGDEATCPCGTAVVYDETNGWQHADGSISHDDGESVSDKMTAVAKAAGLPKALSAPEDWPGWQRDLDLAGIYAGRLRDALRDAVDPRQLAEDWARAHPPADTVAKSLPPSVAAFLATARQAIEAALRKLLPSLLAEGWVLGQQSAQASAAAAAATTPREASAALQAVDWAGWQPGDPEAAYQVAGTGLRDLLASQEVQIKSIASSRLEELGDVLAEHLSSPETSGPVTYSVDSLATALEDVLDNPSRAEMVARTELARASQAAASWVFQAIGVTLVRISTAADARVCGTCRNAESAGAQPIGTYTVPLHPMCVIGSTRVAAAGIKRAYRRLYEGDLAEIATSGGHNLRGTPNHPVLTDRGWVALGDLNEGDYVISGTFDQRAGGKNPDVDDMPAEIGELFDALADSGLLHRVPGRADQFHGDGRDSDVDVVSLDCELRPARNAALDEPVDQLLLALTDLPGLPLSRNGALAPDLDAFDLAPARGVGGLGQGTPRLGRPAGLLDSVSFSSAADVRAAGEQPAPHGPAANSQAAGDGLLGLPANVCRDKVVSVERRPFKGHVFNLETCDGWYLANAIVTHNCRCATVAAMPPLSSSLPGVAASFMGASAGES